MKSEEEAGRVVHGDCLEAMRDIPSESIDAIIQDPPYSTSACKWDWNIMTKIDEFWAEWKRIIKPNGAIVMTASQPFTSKLVMSNLKMFKYEWIWEKNKATQFLDAKRKPLKAHENIIVFCNKSTIYNPQNTIKKKAPTVNKGSRGKKERGACGEVYGVATKDAIQEYSNYPRTVVRFGVVMKPLHPTQKPVALWEYLVKTYTNEGDTIFDGFAGSCTTAIACINTKRNYICIELDEKYYNIGLKRIAEHTAQKTIL